MAIQNILHLLLDQLCLIIKIDDDRIAFAKEEGIIIWNHKTSNWEKTLQLPQYTITKNLKISSVNNNIIVCTAPQGNIWLWNWWTDTSPYISYHLNEGGCSQQICDSALFPSGILIIINSASVHVKKSLRPQ